MSIKSIEMLRLSTETFLIKNPEDVKSRYKQLKSDHKKIGDLSKDVRSALIELMKKKPAEIERATYLLWVAHNLERITDRSINIAERSMFLVGN